MNKNMFVSKMKLFGDTNASLAEAIGLSAQRLSAKINETKGAEFTQGEILSICEQLQEDFEGETGKNKKSAIDPYMKKIGIIANIAGNQF